MNLLKGKTIMNLQSATYRINEWYLTVEHQGDRAVMISINKDRPVHDEPPEADAPQFQYTTDVMDRSTAMTFASRALIEIHGKRKCGVTSADLPNCSNSDVAYLATIIRDMANV